MRLLLTSDWHLDAITGGHDRWPELERYLIAIENAIAEHRVDVVAMLGDVFDPGTSQEARWHMELLRWAYRLTAQCEATIWIAGNHDILETLIDGQPLTVFSPLAALVREAALAPGSMPSDVLGRIHVVETPTLVQLDFVPTRSETTERHRCAIAALPYMARAVAQDDPGGYEIVLDAAKHASTEGTPVVVLGHLMLEGMVPGSEGEMLRGRDVALPVAAIEEVRPALVANGHYHRREVVRRGALDVHIVGAPVHMTFGERDDGDRGFLIVEV